MYTEITKYFYITKICELHHSPLLCQSSGIIAEESTSKGGFKLLYAPTFSKSAEGGKQGASIKELQQLARGFTSSLFAIYPQTASFLCWKQLFESLGSRGILVWVGFFSQESLQSRLKISSIGKSLF